MIDVTSALLDYTKHLHKDDEDRTKHLHVTDITGRCPVGVVLEKAGRVTKTDGGTGKLMRMEVGHITEQFVYDALKHAGLLEDVQKTKYEWPDLNLVGSPDHRVVGDVLVECKSIHPNALDQMDANPERIVKPHVHYVEQLQLYLDKERETRPNVVGKLFYFSLDGRTSEHSIVYNPEIVEAVKKRAAVLNECLKTEKRPSLLPYFVREYSKYRGNVKEVWKVNWKVKYCLTDGIHQHCDPALWEALEPESPEQMVSKLEYQAQKANENGTNPNDWIASVTGRGKSKAEVIDGITYEPVE